MPIGTEIKFSTSSGWGHDQFIGYIHVKPSLLDVKNSEGLCGYVSAGSKDTSDDFTLRNGTILATTSANWEAFAENWRWVKYALLCLNITHISISCTFQCTVKGEKLSYQINIFNH